MKLVLTSCFLVQLAVLLVSAMDPIKKKMSTATNTTTPAPGNATTPSAYAGFLQQHPKRRPARKLLQWLLEFDTVCRRTPINVTFQDYADNLEKQLQNREDVVGFFREIDFELGNLVIELIDRANDVLQAARKAPEVQQSLTNLGNLAFNKFICPLYNYLPELLINIADLVDDIQEDFAKNAPKLIDYLTNLFYPKGLAPQATQQQQIILGAPAAAPASQIIYSSLGQGSLGQAGPPVRASSAQRQYFPGQAPPTVQQGFPQTIPLITKDFKAPNIIQNKLLRLENRRPSYTPLKRTEFKPDDYFSLEPEFSLGRASQSGGSPPGFSLGSSGSPPGFSLGSGGSPPGFSLAGGSGPSLSIQPRPNPRPLPNPQRRYWVD